MLAAPPRASQSATQPRRRAARAGPLNTRCSVEPLTTSVDRDAEGEGASGLPGRRRGPRAEFFEIAQKKRGAPLRFRVRPPRTPCLHNPLSVSYRCYTTYQVRRLLCLLINSLTPNKTIRKRSVSLCLSGWCCGSVSLSVSLSVEEAKSYGVSYPRGCFRPSVISAYDTWF